MSIDSELLKQLAHLTDDELQQLCEACAHLLKRRDRQPPVEHHPQSGIYSLMVHVFRRSLES